VVPEVPIPPWLSQDMEAQRKLFREKFGRDPGPHDPLFFDPDADEPRPMTREQMVARLQAVLDDLDETDPDLADWLRESLHPEWGEWLK
jgi:hypothetical protein